MESRAAWGEAWRGWLGRVQGGVSGMSHRARLDQELPHHCGAEERARELSRQSIGGDKEKASNFWGTFNYFSKGKEKKRKIRSNTTVQTLKSTVLKVRIRTEWRKFLSDTISIPPPRRDPDSLTCSPGAICSK